MKILVTGANGFIAKNLLARLIENKEIELLKFTHDLTLDVLQQQVLHADFIFHLAGVNRPLTEDEFDQGNTELTAKLCDFVYASGRNIPIVFSSSTQALLDNRYGLSKQNAEDKLLELSKKLVSKVFIYRLPNVFGKWCRPNYNSAIATFCHNITHDLAIKVNDSNAKLNLVYIDDVIDNFVELINNHADKDIYQTIAPQYQTTVGEVVAHLQAFKLSRENLTIDAVGGGLIRALYSTYISYLEPQNFTYSVPKYADQRGVFVEMLKTKDSGQFSFFTAHKGVTRGEHYHHTKTEKFLVIKGMAVFGFRHMLTNEYYEIKTNGDDPVIVETIPGWAHNITNIGDDEMIVMLWANEVFDRNKPDTIACKVQ